MTLPSIHLAFPLTEGAFGGANQFLKALRNEFRARGIYTDDPTKASCILFNSHHDQEHVLRLRSQAPSTVFFHRVDGPMRLYNQPNDHRDHSVSILNQAVADATIFQSEWSLNASKRLGFKPAGPITVIGNAPDPTIFHPPKKPSARQKIRLIAASWSDNPNKGFSTYQFLDRSLDFSTCEMRFVGRTPEPFSNIDLIPPCPPQILAEHFREADIFITASKSDPCSNALSEAMHCGLPAIARRDGGHPEIVGVGGLLFDYDEEIPDLIATLSKNLDQYRTAITLPGIHQIADRYVEFMSRVLSVPLKRSIFDHRIRRAKVWWACRRLRL